MATRKAAKTKSNGPAPVPSGPSQLLAVVYGSLLLVYLRFIFAAGITEDPAKVMTQALPGLLLLHMGYCVVVLGNKPGRKLGADVSTALIAAVLSVFFSVIIFSLLVLFGAPALSLVHSTFICAMHMSVLAVLPLFFTYHLDSKVWADIIAMRRPLDHVYAASVCTLIGAWLGAIPIPYDWDRPWQQWPITILAGAYLGYFVGTVGGIALDLAKSLCSKTKKTE
ncbi:Glycosylphosphatidylinositol anchor biosynthesis protein 11 [Yarrowia sp. B02]|nr:Glycosylphosphatidylinositol anchor biosynthesis protein 11 [Yarrowia sp. B02]